MREIKGGARKGWDEDANYLPPANGPPSHIKLKIPQREREREGERMDNLLQCCHAQFMGP
jgi:hypothetical protein